MKVTKCTGEGQGSCKRCSDKGKKNDSNDEMLMIDSVLDKVVPSRYITKSVGREPLRDRYGRPIK